MSPCTGRRATVPSTRSRSSIGKETDAHSCEPRKGTEGSRPSMIVATRRLSELLKPRVLRL